MAPSYEQKTAKIGEIHGTVNLGFKRPVHEGYMHAWIVIRQGSHNISTMMGQQSKNSEKGDCQYAQLNNHREGSSNMSKYISSCR